MKIKFLPYQPHCFAFGGFEVQMLTAFNELSASGTNVGKLDVWDRSDDFDILHCWGLGLANYENVYWAKKAGKKVVTTALLGYHETNIEKVKFYLSSLLHKQRLHLEMLKSIDSVVVVNELQSEICSKYFKIPSFKIKVIPNIVHDKFFEHRNLSSNKKDGNYILCVGNICERKNQVALAQSCLETNLPLLLVGKVLNGEERYANKLEQIINKSKNIKWIKGLKENSDELLEYFSGCLALALPSFIEQQPIALLEAAVLNKPLLIADKAYAKQKYYQNSQLVNPQSVASIKAGLQNVVKDPLKYCPDFESLLECKGASVARAYTLVYQETMY